MSELNFFTPITFNSGSNGWSQAALEVADSYFYLGNGKVYSVTHNDGSKLKGELVDPRDPPSLTSTCLKVISFLTILIPVLMLIAKTILRSNYTYEIVNLNTHRETAVRLQKAAASNVNSPWANGDQLNPQNVIDKLGLDLDETHQLDLSLFQEAFRNYLPQKPLTLRQAAIEVIAEINQLVEKNSGQPRVHLIPSQPSRVDDSNLYFYEQFCGVSSKPMVLDSQEAQKTWLNRILQAFVDNGYIKSREMSSQGHWLTL